LKRNKFITDGQNTSPQGPDLTKGINLHVKPAHFIGMETRILKETKSIADTGLFSKIYIASWWTEGHSDHQLLDSKREVWRFHLKTMDLPEGFLWKIIKTIEWGIRVFLRFRKENIAMVNCHTLSSLPLGVIFKLFCKSKIIYDPHELETEKSMMRGIKRTFFKVLERILIRHADAVIVVSNSIGVWYRNRYGLKNISVIKNFPYLVDNKKSQRPSTLRDKFKIKDGEILFIYQGLLSTGRGIELLLEVFSRSSSNKHIVFLGFGPLEDKVREFEAVRPNIHFHSAVQPQELSYYTASADVGLSIIENVSLSYYYCLPNKMFEYLNCGLPVVISDFPDMSVFVDQYGCGWKTPLNNESILKVIENISQEGLEQKKTNVLKCRGNFCWEKEEKKLLSIYKQLYSKHPS